MPFTRILHIATHSLSIHQLLNGQLAEFPTILDCLLTRIANTASTPIGMEGGMWWGATKWQAKVMPTLKMHELLVNMFRYHYFDDEKIVLLLCAWKLPFLKSSHICVIEHL